MGALADASAKLDELAAEISSLDMSQEKEDFANFLGAVSNAIAHLASAVQDVLNLVSRDNAGDQPEPPAPAE